MNNVPVDKMRFHIGENYKGAKAYGIGRGDEVGTLEVGKKADMVIWYADSFGFLCYRMGSNLAIETIKGGEIF